MPLKPCKSRDHDGACRYGVDNCRKTLNIADIYQKFADITDNSKKSRKTTRSWDCKFLDGQPSSCGLHLPFAVASYLFASPYSSFPFLAGAMSRPVPISFAVLALHLLSLSHKVFSYYCGPAEQRLPSQLLVVV